MILFTLLLTAFIVFTIFAAFFLITGGAAFIVVFGDVIVFALLVWWIARYVYNHRK